MRPCPGQALIWPPKVRRLAERELAQDLGRDPTPAEVEQFLVELAPAARSLQRLSREVRTYLEGQRS